MAMQMCFSNEINSLAQFFFFVFPTKYFFVYVKIQTLNLDLLSIVFSLVALDLSVLGCAYELSNAVNYF